jgi:TctA family transporter
MTHAACCRGRRAERDPAHSVFDHRTGDPGDLRDRRVHGAQRRVRHIWLMLAFGIVGYVFKKLDYPLAPLVLALVLGDRAEDAFRQSMLASRGGLDIFWNNGLVGTIMTLAVVGLVWSLLGSVRERFSQRAA